MEAKKIKLAGLPEMTEAEVRQYILDKTRGRDLFPEKTANARKFLQKLSESQQKLIP